MRADVNGPARHVNWAVYDAGGNLLAINESVTIGYKFDDAGTYFISFFDNVFSNSYELEVASRPDDNPDDASAPVPLPTNGRASLTYTQDFKGDSDWFAINISEDGNIVLFDDLFGDWKLHDSNFNEIGLPTYRQDFDDYIFEFDTAGRYYLELISTVHTLSARTITAFQPDDEYAGDNTTDAQLIVDGASVAGEIQYNGDEDWFIVDIGPDNQFIEFNYSDNNNPLSVAAFSIHDAMGQEVFNALQQLDGMVFKFDVAGQYFLSITDAPNANKGYTIAAVSTNVADDLAGNVNTTSMLSLDGRENTGQADFINDEDWHAISVRAGDRIEFNLIDSSRSVPKAFSLFDRFGQEIRKELLIELSINNTFTHSFAEAGIYYLGVAQVSGAGSVIGEYRFTAQLLPRRLDGDNADNVLQGTSEVDVITGLGGNDELYGLSGNDRLFGQFGDDLINGGTGDDYINGGQGDDELIGSSGNDELVGGGGNDLIKGGVGDDTAYGGAAMDTIFGHAGNDLIYGENGNDTLYGNDGEDQMFGGQGLDYIYGGNDNDQLFGEGNTDYLFGDAGDDIIDGGSGNDRLTGGTGADTFVFATGHGRDFLKDFENGVDTIDFSALTLAPDFAAVSAAARQAGTNVIIEFNANNILIIENFTLSDLDSSDFLF